MTKMTKLADKDIKTSIYKYISYIQEGRGKWTLWGEKWKIIFKRPKLNFQR